MTLDPETIAAILAVLIPMIQDCLANRKTEAELVAMLCNPNRGQRFVLLFGLNRENRRVLREYWRGDSEQLDAELATELIEMAKEESQDAQSR